MSSLTTTAAPLTPPNGDILYEVVNGEVRELPPMGAFETSLANILLGHLEPFCRDHGLGRAFMEMLFLFNRSRSLQLRPDVAFVSYGRWPRGQGVPDTAAWEVVPNLAAEVVSRSNTWDEIVEKIRNYFDAGVERVWVVSPRTEQVYVYSAPNTNRIVDRNETLEGEDIVPGFALPLAQLF